MTASSPRPNARSGRSLPAAPGEGAAQLRRVLGTSPPDELAAAGDDALADLAAPVRDAQRRQTRTLLRAQDAALRSVPWPLRGIVKKTITG